MTSLPPDTHPLFDAKNLAHVATIMDDGSPQVTPVWVMRDGDTIVFNTAKGRVKHRNIVRDPRVAISIHAQEDLYTYVQVRGRAQLVDDPDRAGIDALSNKYLGRDYPFAGPDEERVTVRVEPESVDFRPPRSQSSS